MAYIEYSGYSGCKEFLTKQFTGSSIWDPSCVDWACAPDGAKNALQAIFLYKKCQCVIKKKWCPPGKTPESYDEGGGIVSQLSSISSSDVPSLLSQYWWIIAGGIIIYLLVKK